MFEFDVIAQRVKPYSLLGIGKLFGVFEVLDRVLDRATGSHALPRANWSISSGARSIVILAPAGMKQFLGYIKEAGAESGLPSLLTALSENWESYMKDHWEMMCMFANNLAWHWSSRVLLFPIEWIGLSQGDQPEKRYGELHNYLHRLGWSQSTLIRQYATEEQAIRKKWNKAPGAALFGDRDLGYQILRDIIAIGRGNAPALAPSTSAALAGPFDKFQAALGGTFMKLKGKRQSFPVVLQPSYLDESGKMGYYDLRQPEGKWGSHAKNVVEPISDVLNYIHATAPELLENIDFERLRFFCRSGRVHDGNRIVDPTKSNEPLDQEFLPPDAGGKVFLDAPFLTASMRIMRK